MSSIIWWPQRWLRGQEGWWTRRVEGRTWKSTLSVFFFLTPKNDVRRYLRFHYSWSGVYSFMIRIVVISCLYTAYLGSWGGLQWPSIHVAPVGPPTSKWPLLHWNIIWRLFRIFRTYGRYSYKPIAPTSNTFPFSTKPGNGQNTKKSKMYISPLQLTI